MESWQDLETLAAAHGSPLYVFHGDRLAANFRAIQRAFERRYPRLIIGYSYKTNYLPHLCQLIRELGGYAEVVSRLEYDLALAIGHDPSTILFNGPLKTADDLELALRHHSVVNLDGLGELQYVVAMARRRPAEPLRIGLRVNVDLSDP
jgi:diaminopimelate decarboxylase